ncbi:jg11011 [Pararge aegeria aegeria]|uniref:Jg11011 protein n=1 Tax=Pararge aegeria aegeria TaxID=348720 RepID=A0A8S4SD02_9NEOP|nr:jg11011 [Pararge aegeria aegeria]
MKNKDYDLTNKNKFLENKVIAVEQRLMNFEQSQLSKKIEIAGIPEVEGETLQEIISKTAAKLSFTTNDIELVNWSRTGKSNVICLDMKNDDAKKNVAWGS